MQSVDQIFIFKNPSHPQIDPTMFFTIPLYKSWNFIEEKNGDPT